MFSPNAATTAALQAISIAALSSEPIDIVPFSGGAQAFSTAFGLLNPSVQSRIASITYVDPGAVGGLAGGVKGTFVRVLGDFSDVVNQILQIAAGSPTNPQPANAEYIDTASCGHNLDCVINKYGDFLATNGTYCSVGAGAVFGQFPSRYQYTIVAPVFTYPAYIITEIPPTPVVTTKITYDAE